MNIVIIPITETYFYGLRQALDAVAREKQFLTFLKAPPMEECFAFYRHIVKNDICHFIAIQEGVVLGWCDVLPTHGESRAHVGELGIGLIPSARGLGIGRKLIETALSKAWGEGFTRIELSVRADNTHAKAFYERFGFVVEGLNRNDFFVDGVYYDSYSMALIR